MPCIVIGLVSVHVWDVGFVFVGNSLSDLIVSNVIPSIRICEIGILIIFLDLFDHTWIIRFHLHLCTWICRTDHTKGTCRMSAFHIRNLIYQVIAKLQSGQLDGIVGFYILDIHHIRLYALFFDFISQIFYKVTELTVTPFQFLFCLCSFHLVGVQRLNVIDYHIFCHIIHGNRQCLCCHVL